MNNKEVKKLCLDLMRASNCKKVVEILKSVNLWDDKSLWRNYGDKEGSWGTVNNQGNPSFALTEKITNSVDAVLMNKCYEKKLHPKSNDPNLPKTPTEAVHKYFETKKEISSYKFEDRLFKSEIDSVAGLQVYWDDKKARTVAENINVSVGGKGKHPNIAIVDKGEGQTPESLPGTLMSLHVGNKKNINFAQGKWNQGGSGAIRHTGADSGRTSMQFVLTKRNPNIVKNFIKEQVGKYDEWSFTILRRDRPPKGSTDVSEVTYLSPLENNMPLSFKSDKLPIFPGKDGNQFGKDSEYGTLIILYEYNLATSSAIRGSTSLYRRLDAQLPRLPLPVRLYETRKHVGVSEREQSLTMRGFSNFQENQYIKKQKSSPLEEISPRRGFIRCENYKITYDIFCFKKGLGKTYIPGNAGLLWTVNGQTHAITKQKSIFNIDKLSFNEITEDLIVIIDCTDISGGDREDFFKSSRDRLDTDFHLYKEVRDSLIDDLSKHEDLQNIIQKRIDESLDDKEITDPKTLEDIQKLLHELPEDEKDFLPPGLTLKKETKKEEGSGRYNLPKKTFPTFVCFKELKKNPQAKQHIKKDIQINQKVSYSLHTDAVDDYFDRRTSPGLLNINWILNEQKIEPKSFNRVLKNGSLNITRIKLPENIKEGDLLNLELLINDKQNEEGFKLTSSLIVKPTQKKQKPKTKPPKPPKPTTEETIPPEGGQGINTVEEVIQNPIIAQYVTKDEWLSKCGYEWNEDEVLHVKKHKVNGKNHYNLFLNKDNINLEFERRNKGTTQYTPQVIETKYKMGISLIAMFTLMQFRRDQNKKRTMTVSEGENGEAKPIPEELIIKIATRNAGKGLFTLSKYLESLGKSASKNRISEQEDI